MSFTDNTSSPDEFFTVAFIRPEGPGGTGKTGWGAQVPDTGLDKDLDVEFLPHEGPFEMTIYKEKKTVTDGFILNIDGGHAANLATLVSKKTGSPFLYGPGLGNFAGKVSFFIFKLKNPEGKMFKAGFRYMLKATKMKPKDAATETAQPDAAPPPF